MTGYKFVKVRSKCQIKGCRSTGLKVPTFSVAASREGGASVVVCEKCIEAMFEKLCLMRGVPTYAELVEMQNAECKGQNDENNAKTPETVDGEGVNEEPAGVPDEEAAVMVTEEPAGEQEAVEGEGVSEEPVGVPDEEAVDKAPEVKKTTRKKSAEKSE